MNNGGFLGFGRGAPNLATPIARYIQSPVYYSSTTVIPPPGTKQIHCWLVGGGGGGSKGQNHNTSYGHNQHHSHQHYGGGGGFGGAACFDIPVTTDPLVVTIGAGGTSGSSGGQSRITIAGMIVAQVGGGAGTSANEVHTLNGGGARYGGSGAGGGVNASGHWSYDHHNETWNPGTGIGQVNPSGGHAGGEPPGAGKGGSRVISWIYSDPVTMWRGNYTWLGAGASTLAPYNHPAYSFLRPSATTLATLQGAYGGQHGATQIQQATTTIPFPWGTAINGPLHTGSNPSAGVVLNGGSGTGYFGAGGHGGGGQHIAEVQGTHSPGHHTAHVPSMHKNAQAAYGGGGGGGGGQGYEGGGGGGAHVPGYPHGPAFAGSAGQGGSFPNTPHLWGLRTGQATSTGGAGLFLPSTTATGAAGGGGAGANTTFASQQGSVHNDTPWHTTTGGPDAGGSGCAVFRFYI